MLDNQAIGLLGYWLNAIGQTMSALANTPFAVIDKKIPPKLDMLGNVLQGTGTALVADTIEELSYEKLGNQLGAIGNLMVVVSFFAPVSDKAKEEISEKGDILQALGVSVSLPDDLQEGFTLESFFDLFGNYLQVIEIKGVDEELVSMIAEWSQALAAILALMDAMKVAVEENVDALKWSK